MKQPTPSGASDAIKSTSKQEEVNSGNKAVKSAARKKIKSSSKESGMIEVINFYYKLIKYDVYLKFDMIN